MKKHYVYLLINKVNNKIYIGVHHGDWQSLSNYYGSGKRITMAVKKYGIRSFERKILGKFSRKEDAYLLEKNLVTEDFIAREDTYNIKVGGLGGWDYCNSDPNNAKKLHLKGNLGQKSKKPK